MMNYYDPLIYVVSAEEEGFYLKTILMNRMKISRKLLSKLKMTEYGILVNGERQYVSMKVSTGDRIEVRMPVETSEDILPQQMPLHILFEDEHLLILNKPAGIIVHPTHGHYLNTLANGVVHYWAEKGEQYRFRPIHRLDQETSGVIAIAKNPYVHQALSEQMQAGQVHKEYLAIVYGQLPEASGTINAPIDRSDENPHVRVVRPDGYPAVTHYRVQAQYKDASLVNVELETGRTHQIRVHMKHMGCPLIGDKLYIHEDDQRNNRSVILNSHMDRHALHAFRLGFYHPIHHTALQFEAPIPEDIESLLEQLTT